MFGCSKMIATKNSPENKAALGAEYLDDSIHRCGWCTNTCGTFYAYKTLLVIEDGRFDLQVSYESKQPEVISGRLLQSGDTVTLVSDSSSEWGKIPSLESNYLLSDSSLKPILVWTDGEVKNSLIPGCLADSTHEFIKIK